MSVQMELKNLTKQLIIDRYWMPLKQHNIRQNDMEK